MYITKARKYHKDTDGKYVAYGYFRLPRKRYDQYGRQKVDHFCLGQLDGLTKRDRDELADMLTVMIEQGRRAMSFNPVLYEMAMDFYVKYRETHPAEDYDPVLRAEAERKEAECRRDLVTISIKSMVQKEARIIGPEAICRSTSNVLKIREFLNSKGWSREQVDLALMQIIARAIYPFSELKTVRCLRDNSALLEMFKLERKKVTKDALYQSAIRLWEVHREMEDFLHERVRSMFNLEENILLMDISNTYFEGRMEDSGICFRGRSKERRDDCKIVVLAAVVNTDGLLVRTMIYEGNRQDVTTVKDVVGTLAGQTSPEARKIVVMDAGFYSAANVRWLVENHFDYITVLPSGYAKFTADSDKVVRHEDCRHQEIRLQMGEVEIEGVRHKAHLNLAVLAYWIVSVTRYRLKLKKYPNIRWEEIIRIAQTQVVVTAEAKTEDGGCITVRQSMDAEEQLSTIYSLLDINPNPIGKIKSQVHPKSPQKIRLLRNRELPEIYLQCGLKICGFPLMSHFNQCLFSKCYRDSLFRFFKGKRDVYLNYFC